MIKILGIIPARYESSRFPGKPLANLHGKTMIQRVYEQACKVAELHQVVVATDDQRIFDHVQEFGGHVVMTSPSHTNGTERCCEVYESHQETLDYVVNIQGDEPYINPETISTLCSILDGDTEIGTLLKQVEDVEVLNNPNIVKAVTNLQNEAIYFSRSCIPHVRGKEMQDWLTHHVFYKHIGIYAYRGDILSKITRLEQGLLEKTESLEQLRWLEHGFKIKTATTQHESEGIDTPDDLERALRTNG